MCLQSVRPVILSALAILFGTVQAFCICANARAAAPPHNTHQMQHEGDASFGMAHSSLPGSGIMPDLTGHEGSPQGGDHDHSGDCSHCMDVNMLVGTNDIIVPASVPLPADRDFSAQILSMTRFARPLIGLHMWERFRWLHPPSPTLVELKIRLTI